MPKAKKTDSGNYRVQIMIDGKRKSFTAPTRKEAEYLASEYQLHHANKGNVLNITLGEAMQRYIDNKTEILSPSTIRSYDSIRRNKLLELQEVKLINLSRENIQVAINEESAKLSPKSVRNITGFLSAVLSEYYPEFTFNPKLPQKKKNDIVIPDKQTVENLIISTETADIELCLAIILASNCGLRRGEICALEWNDIDFTNKTISISKSMVRNKQMKWLIKQPKSYAGYRVVPMTSKATELLQRMEHKQDRIVSFNPSALTKRFGLRAKRLNITCTFHQLRHYYASVMLALGIPDKYAMELMGHATNNMLKTVYQHTMEERKQQVINDVVSYFNG